MNKKGFTLIEILAVIIIIAIIVLIAVPSVSSSIENSRKSAYIDIINSYTNKVKNEITSRNIVLKKDGSTYYIPIDILDVENGAVASPYGDWATIDTNIRYLAMDDDEVLTCDGVAQKTVTKTASIPSYMIYNERLAEYDDNGKTYEKVSQGCIPAGTVHEAYVVVRYNKTKNKYDYYWTSRDVTGHTVALEDVDTITAKDIVIKDAPIISLNTTKKYAAASNNTSNRTKFDYDEVTARSSFANSKVSLYFKNKNLTGGSAALKMTAAEARKCFEFKVINGNAIQIINYDKTCGPEVEVPSEIDGYPVTTIGSDAFNGKGLTKVVIHDGVTTIGSYAFYNNQISELYLPNTKVSIGGMAFARNQLTEINISKNTSISGGSFSNNKIPEDQAFIYLLDSNGNPDYTTLLGYAGSEKNLVIPDSVNGVALKTIAGSAFRSMSLKSVVIPDSVERINSWAFAGNSLTSIDWPSNLKIIESVAFQSNGLTTLSNLPSTITSMGARAFNGNKVNDGSEYVYARYSDGRINYTTLVSYAGSNKNIYIPDEVDGVALTNINDWAFYGCGIKEILNIPSTVTKIGAQAFINNSVPDSKNPFIYKRKSDGTVDYSTIISYAGSNDNVVIPGEVEDTKLTTIAANSFTWSGLKSIVIPEGVTTIGGTAFAYNSIKQITVPSTISADGLGSNCFGKTGYPNNYNKALVKIIYNGENPLKWAKATGATTNNGTFVTGTLEHAAGNIEIVAPETS
jgi:prepilin-type N-terminal cleavage/methylation domain-containing protein